VTARVGESLPLEGLPVEVWREEEGCLFSSPECAPKSGAAGGEVAGGRIWIEDSLLSSFLISLTTVGLSLESIARRGIASSCLMVLGILEISVWRGEEEEGCIKLEMEEAALKRGEEERSGEVEEESRGGDGVDDMTRRKKGVVSFLIKWNGGRGGGRGGTGGWAGFITETRDKCCSSKLK